ncbi:MAG: LysM peptidoglycan-binding domain-containing protein [Anaerolineae bacterium]|nr:MAG: LysM peptidoglycan-binding domain-containing protein [Anaerolineae bacterium]
MTFTPTLTPSPTLTPTVTLTPTETFTPTPSAPFTYVVEEGDSLALIAEKFNLGENGILLLLMLNPAVDERGGIVYVGEEILVPNPGMELPTATPIPPDLPRGTTVEYKVLPGDTLAGIANKFNSTVDAIVEENNLDNPNDIFVGEVLVIPVNLVTPIPPTITPTPTFTPVPSGPTATPQAGGGESNPPCAYTENADFVTQLRTLVNDFRTQNGLSTLTWNEQLAAAAKEHSIDMACNNYLSHTGSDNSSPADRVAAQGYSASLVVEDIYAQPPEYGGDAQAAFDWWVADAQHRADLLNASVTEFGIAYAYFAESDLRGYFTLVMAAP